jgi:hypothetical protein
MLYYVIKMLSLIIHLDSAKDRIGISDALWE